MSDDRPNEKNRVLHKNGFKSLDFGLFELLGGHAATAVDGATRYSLSDRKRSTLEEVMELLRGSLAARSSQRGRADDGDASRGGRPVAARIGAPRGPAWLRRGAPA